MSRRNSHGAKARRRRERARAHAEAAADMAAGRPAADVHDLDELAELAARGERMPCGCDPAAMLARAEAERPAGAAAGEWLTLTLAEPGHLG